jgi:hypothetical protein
MQVTAPAALDGSTVNGATSARSVDEQPVTRGHRRCEPMRWTQVLAGLLIVLLVAACGGGGSGDGNGGDDGGESQAAGDGDDGGDDGGNGDDESQPADDGDGDDGNGGNGGSTDDAEEAFAVLTPPNAEEVTKTTASGVIFAAFTTPDSVDSLVSFYEDAFDELGLQILTTTETADGISWFVGTDENASEFGGVISVIPNTEGGTGSSVSVQIGATN